MNKKLLSILFLCIFGFTSFISAMNEFRPARITRTIARQINGINECIDNGMNPDLIKVTTENIPAIIFAIKIGDSPLLKKILDNGGSPNRVLQILPGFDFNNPNPDLFKEYFPFEYALQINNVEAAQFLYNNPQVNKDRVLFSLVKHWNNYNSLFGAKLFKDFFHKNWHNNYLAKNKDSLHYIASIAIYFQCLPCFKQLVFHYDFDLEHPVVIRINRDEVKIVTVLSAAVEKYIEGNENYLKLLLFKKYLNNSLHVDLIYLQNHISLGNEILGQTKLYQFLQKPEQYIKENYNEFEGIERELKAIRKDLIENNISPHENLYQTIFNREYNISRYKTTPLSKRKLSDSNNNNPKRIKYTSER